MGLKEMRKTSGISQQTAAEIFKLKYRTYQNYENGITSPDMETAAKFARYFNCTIGELFDLKEGGNPPLTDDEMSLISTYRNVAPRDRNLILSIAKLIESHSI